MTTLDIQSPVPNRATPRLEDADRVDVRGLLHAIAGRHMLVAGIAIGMAVLFYVVTGLLPSTWSANSKVMLDPRHVSVVPSQEVVQSLNLSEPVILSEMSVMRSNILIGNLIDKIGIERLETALFDAPQPDTNMESRMSSLTWAIRRDLTIRREGESYVIAISFEGRDRGLVADIANGIADTYIETQLANRRESVRQATTWIGEQVEEARIAVEAAEAAVLAYKSDRLARDGGSVETANQQLANLTGQLVAARAERVAAEAQFDQLKTILVEQGAAGLAKAVTSPVLERLAQDRLDLQRQDGEWARSFGTDHPQRLRIRSEMERLDAQLATEAQRVIDLRSNEVTVARLREASLAEGIHDLEDRIAGISENSLGLLQLDREASAARQNYESLLTRFSAASGQDRLQRPDARIIERATYPDVPSAPRPRLMAFFGLMLGGTIGIGLALFTEMTRATFRTRREIEAETGVKVLATLPRVGGGDLKEVIAGLRWNPNSMFGERIRQLRTFLFMQGRAADNRVVLVTSSYPDEGKSMTAMALAEMAALAGKSVILVDADLRRSHLVKSFGWEPEYDLADFILERSDLAESILTDHELGIHVLAAANPCPEAADDLNTDWLRPMMEELKRVYDVVIVDSPPLLKVSDGLVLAQVADSIVYVVRWDVTPRSAVAEGLDALAGMNLGVTGIVLNQVDPKVAEKAYGEGYAAYA